MAVSPLTITIGSTVIEFPVSGTDPNWAQAVDDFVLAVQNQFLITSAPYDVAPQTEDISGTLAAGSITLSPENVNFPNGAVRSFKLTYTIYRQSDSTSIFESGVLTGTYDTKNLAWIYQDEFTGSRQANGDTYHSFYPVGDNVGLSFTILPGVTLVTNKISYYAKTELVTS
jgi:hypothetical protein